MIMGSQSDWETMRHAVAVLEALDVAHEVRIVSAHRTPDRLADYARTAAARALGHHRRRRRRRASAGHVRGLDHPAGSAYRWNPTP
jgi:nucleotide-binding universal stress UspA family protein